MIRQITDAGIINIFKGKNTEPIKLVIGEILTAEIMDIFPTGRVQVKINDRILNAQLQRQIPLNKGDVVYVKVENPLSDGTVPLRILSLPEEEVLLDFTQRGTESIQFSGSQELHEVFQQQTKSIPLLSSSTTQNIVELIELIDNKQFKSEAEFLKNFLISMPDLTPEKLKEALLNSLGFSKLPESVKSENIQNDLKSILNSLIKNAEKHGIQEVVQKAEQILKQIEGYQILSHNFKSFFTFLPVFWKELDGGNIAFQSFKRQGKNYYTVFVNLNFKDSSLNFLVTMINKNFYISFAGDSDILENIKENETILKNRFAQAGIPLSGIRYVTTEELIKQWSITEGLVSVTV